MFKRWQLIHIEKILRAKFNPTTFALQAVSEQFVIRGLDWDNLE